MGLSSNHLTRSFEDFAKDAVKSSVVSETAYVLVSLRNLQFFII